MLTVIRNQLKKAVIRIIVRNTLTPAYDLDESLIRNESLNLPEISEINLVGITTELSLHASA
jgi:hypothetical protein